MTTEIENKYVYNTYEMISGDFSRTRTYVWKCVKVFLDQMGTGDSLLEIGCGNGKNLEYRKDICTKGIDFVPSFVDMCQSKGLDVIEGNAICLPFEDNTFDCVISIAVFHHLSSEDRRKKALEEMYRVLKVGGKGLVVCWAYEQTYDGKESTSKRILEKGDQYVGWNGSNPRFYHCYDKKSFELYTNSIEGEKTIEWEEGNWILQFTKRISS
jgi:ubiquinone/menaquinone biosynthesis C-methylase UbiE